MTVLDLWAARWLYRMFDAELPQEPGGCWLSMPCADDPAPLALRIAWATPASTEQHT